MELCNESTQAWSCAMKAHKKQHGFISLDFTKDINIWFMLVQHLPSY